MRNRVKCPRQSRLSATLERESVTQWRKKKEKKKADYRSVSSRSDRRLKEILTRGPVHPFRPVTPKNIKRAIHRDSIEHSRANPFVDYPFLITFDHVREESFYSHALSIFHQPFSLAFTFQSFHQVSITVVTYPSRLSRTLIFEIGFSSGAERETRLRQKLINRSHFSKLL